ncbi:hypothetical protein M8818_002418 [Zalaria obscura]|uniref:Uncharacterized protein n=1 Tax=Zalaria obscura TaxID=2024903 RepID=A0ACC3SI47_9PEZI
MRIAIAGTGGLACAIADCIQAETSHQVILLSRSVREAFHTESLVQCAILSRNSIKCHSSTVPKFPNRPPRTPAHLPAVPLPHHHNPSPSHPTPNQTNPPQRPPPPHLTPHYRIHPISYTTPSTLTHALLGCDTVISTAPYPAQTALIHAAITAHVRRFAPAEFEAPPEMRAPDGPLDRGRAQARRWLGYYEALGRIEGGVFVVGVLYERFGPRGLRGVGTGMGTGVEGMGEEGAFLVDVRGGKAVVIVKGDDEEGEGEREVRVCLTGLRDVGRFVTRALELPRWSGEMRCRGQRMGVGELVALVQVLVGMYAEFFQLRLQEEMIRRLMATRKAIQFADPYARVFTV